MIYFFYAIIFLGLTLYSYSQIDLNLTLSSDSIYQTFQNQLITLGYYNRALSALFYLMIIMSLFGIYFFLIDRVIKRQISLLKIVIVIVISVMISFFSYPAFSHDFFNYIFDARIVTKYQSNPYFYTALDFPTDLWTRFMHWTHRKYPYGPLWLLITLPFSYFGFEKFVLTLMNFKLLFAFFHLGNLVFIYKIMKNITPKHALTALVFYALNPLIILESIVSPHNEVMMLFFFLVGIYLFINNKFIFSLGSIIASGMVKFITLPFLPIFIVFQLFSKKNFLHLLWLSFVMISGGIILEIYFREPYPWYFIMLIGVGSLLIQFSLVKFILFGVSIGALLRYVPFLYYGDYSPITKTWQYWCFVLPIIVFVLIPLVISSTKKYGYFFKNGKIKSRR